VAGLFSPSCISALLYSETAAGILIGLLPPCLSGIIVVVGCLTELYLDYTASGNNHLFSLLLSSVVQARALGYCVVINNLLNESDILISLFFYYHLSSNLFTRVVKMTSKAHYYDNRR
jgi:hypothetical protein